MTKHNDNTRRGASHASFSGADATPPDLLAVERLLDRLGAHERACAPFGMEDRIAFGTGAVGISLDALASAEGAIADAELETRVYAGTRSIVREGGARLGGAVEAPAGLEERIFQATRSSIRGRSTLRADFARRSTSVSARRADLPMRIGAWSARLAAVLALGGGVWLAWASFRGETSPPGVTPPVIVAHEDLTFDEFDDVLESHLAFMQTVEYRPAELQVLDEDWCTSCELIEIEEEISS